MVWVWLAATALAQDPSVVAHLERVSHDLRASEIHADPPQRARRHALLDALDAYRVNGVFPTNEEPGRPRTVEVEGAFPDDPDRRPVFVDDDGVHCAVGHLLHVDGRDDLVRAVRDTDNHGWLPEIDVPGLADWAEGAGFTLTELARIQPTYGDHSCINAFKDPQNSYGGDVSPEQATECWVDAARTGRNPLTGTRLSPADRTKAIWASVARVCPRPGSAFGFGFGLGVTDGCVEMVTLADGRGLALPDQRLLEFGTGAAGHPEVERRRFAYDLFQRVDTPQRTDREREAETRLVCEFGDRTSCADRLLQVATGQSRGPSMQGRLERTPRQEEDVAAGLARRLGDGQWRPEWLDLVDAGGRHMPSSVLPDLHALGTTAYPSALVAWLIVASRTEGASMCGSLSWMGEEGALDRFVGGRLHAELRDAVGSCPRVDDLDRHLATLRGPPESPVLRCTTDPGPTPTPPGGPLEQLLASQLDGDGVPTVASIQRVSDDLRAMAGTLIPQGAVPPQVLQVRVSHRVHGHLTAGLPTALGCALAPFRPTGVEHVTGRDWAVTFPFVVDTRRVAARLLTPALRAAGVQAATVPASPGDGFVSAMCATPDAAQHTYTTIEEQLARLVVVDHTGVTHTETWDLVSPMPAWWDRHSCTFHSSPSRDVLDQRSAKLSWCLGDEGAGARLLVRAREGAVVTATVLDGADDGVAACIEQAAHRLEFVEDVLLDIELPWTAP